MLFQYIATPIVTPWAHWLVFALFSVVAFFLLFIIVMQRVEIMTKDPLMNRDPAVLDEDTLRKTHRALHAMLVDNERRLAAREVAIRRSLAIGLLATILGLVFTDR